MIDTGNTALALLAPTEDRRAVEPRLDAGLLDGMRADLNLLEQLVAGATSAREGVHRATLERDEALALAHRYVMAIGLAVEHTPGASVRRAYGVGRPVPATSVAGVAGAAATILARTHAQPAEARAFGILPAELDRLEGMVPVISARSATQRAKKAAAPDATRQRNQAA